MSQPVRVGVLVGSLRAEAFSRKIAKALIARAPASLQCRIIEIGALPLYNEDLDAATPPEPWTRFRDEIRASDAILFVTPEYNRSIPGGLKNAVDVASRPSGENTFDGKPAGVVSVTPYGVGAFGANHALRQTFAFLNMLVMQQPEAYVSKVGDLLDEKGEVKSKETAQFLEQFMRSFERWVSTVHTGSAAADFSEFMRNREKIALDYVNGETSSLDTIVTQSDPASFFAPKGGCLQGAAAVASRYKSDGSLFQKGATTHLEVFQSQASGTLAFWTGLQHAKVRMGKGSEAVSMHLRVTEVYRLEAGAFKLVHRHADPLTASSQ
jgi:NAD(P)H-dependent FMN reductase/ketosteroid isomerase-like protein